MDLSLSADQRALVIVAGGAGRRMGGVNKALLRFPDRTTILERILATYRSACAEAHLVATAGRAAELSALPDCPPVIVDAGAGPARALLEAAGRIARRWLFVVGGDQAQPDREALVRLWGAADPARGAIAARSEGFLQPLTALYRTAALRGHRGEEAALTDLLVALDPAVIEPWPPALARSLRGVNTWAEAEALGLTCDPGVRAGSSG
jgi:molybdopterin-guanine dinucleotide biosynthesis protein A